MTTTTTSSRSQQPLLLDGALTIRQAVSLKEKLRAALAAADDVELAVEDDADADLSFVQLIESARIEAATLNKSLQLASPAQGQVLETLQRAGFTTTMSSESRAFWYHEKESL